MMQKNLHKIKLSHKIKIIRQHVNKLSPLNDSSATQRRRPNVFNVSNRNCVQHSLLTPLSCSATAIRPTYKDIKTVVIWHDKRVVGIFALRVRRNAYLRASGQKSDISIHFNDPDFLLQGITLVGIYFRYVWWLLVRMRTNSVNSASVFSDHNFS